MIISSYLYLSIRSPGFGSAGINSNAFRRYSEASFDIGAECAALSVPW
jgi:hypothetical protein